MELSWKLSLNQSRHHTTGEDKGMVNTGSTGWAPHIPDKPFSGLHQVQLNLFAARLRQPEHKALHPQADGWGKQWWLDATWQPKGAALG